VHTGDTVVSLLLVGDAEPVVDISDDVTADEERLQSAGSSPHVDDDGAVGRRRPHDQ